MAFVEEAIISGFIGEVVSRCVDFSWTKIKEAVKDRKDNHQNIESQIYNMAVNVLNQITNKKFVNNQDKIYQAAERILRGYKDVRCDSIEVVRSGLQILGENVNEDKYIQFKTLLYQEISKNDHEELYRQIRLFQQDKESERTSRIEHSVNEVKQEIGEIKQVVLSGKNENGEKTFIIQNSKFQNNKKQDYIKIWNSRLFLHVDNDENPLTLADAFIIPDIKIIVQGFCFVDNYNKTLNRFVERFMNYPNSSTMLIIGVPGIGKSSITSWIANEYKKDDNVIILRFRDWDSKELKKGLLKAVCNTLKCEKGDLENKILIFDGFDEMKALNIRKKVLNTFFNDIKDFNKFKCIIMSRTGYISSENFKNVIELQVFDIAKVEKFHTKITGKDLNVKEKIKSNLDVLGIPVILYMAIMSDIDISKNPTKPELYDRIFAEREGIFDKFGGYDKGTQILRHPDNINIYLNFLRQVAFELFEKNELRILKRECEIPKLEFQGKSTSILEFPIKHLFDNVEINIEFIHKSIYEYFVADYIFETISKGIVQSLNNFVGILGKLFIYGYLSPEILEFLEDKVRNSELNRKYEKVNTAFKIMLQDGMTYHTHEFLKNVIVCEMNVFTNMLELVHLWDVPYFKFDENICNYLKYDMQRKINLETVNLSGLDLSKANLGGANLNGVYLVGTNLNGADLSEADLSTANLSNANLTKANLSNADLNGADLREAELKEADLRGIDLKNADLENAKLRNAIVDRDDNWFWQSRKKNDLNVCRVYIKETDEIINYGDYCKRKNEKLDMRK